MPIRLHIPSRVVRMNVDDIWFVHIFRILGCLTCTVQDQAILNYSGRYLSRLGGRANTGRYRAHRCSSGSPEPEQVRCRHSCPTVLMAKRMARDTRSPSLALAHSNNRGGQAPALREKKRYFTVGRGPVPRRASVGTGNGLGQRVVFARVECSQGTGPALR